MNVKLCLSLRAGTACCALALAGFFSAPAAAGVITGATQFGANSGTGPGLGTVSVPAIITVLANNDNVPAPQVLDNNIFVPIKRFDHNGNIDIELHVAPSQGVTEYQVFESVDNNTGTNWNQYKMSLGFGVGGNFIPSPAGDGLDFDSPNFDTPPASSAFALVALGEDNLTFMNGSQGAAAETYQFRIDVPDLGLGVGGVGGTFTLRQTPVPVPEPSALLLACIAIGGFVACRRGR
jgi:hypothetical protein